MRVFADCVRIGAECNDIASICGRALLGVDFSVRPV